MTSEGDKKINPDKRPIKSFEADKDVAEMLQSAQNSGLVLGEICNRALRECGMETIREIIAERRQAQAQWEKAQKDKTLTSKEAKALVGEGSSRAARLRQESGKKQKAESPIGNKSSRASSGRKSSNG